VAAEGKALEDVATPLSVIGKPSEAIFRTGSDREGIDPVGPGYGRDSTVAGTEGRDVDPSVPDPRLSGQDDTTRPRPPDDGMPLA
jgi:hypothetical protein